MFRPKREITERYLDFQCGMVLAVIIGMITVFVMSMIASSGKEYTLYNLYSIEETKIEVKMPSGEILEQTIDYLDEVNGVYTMRTTDDKVIITHERNVKLLENND